MLLILHDSLKMLGDGYEITTIQNGRDALQAALDEIEVPVLLVR